MIEKDAKIILGRIDPDADMEHPVQTLMNLIRAKAAEVAWLRFKVQELDEAELVWGKTEQQEGVGPQGPVDVSTYKAEQNIWWKQLREAENQLASWTSMAAKAGVDERLAKVSELQAQEFVGALNRILSALELSETQRALVPEIVPNILRSLA